MRKITTLSLAPLFLGLVWIPLACVEDSDEAPPEDTTETITVAITSPDDASFTTGVVEITLDVTGEVVQIDFVVDDTLVESSTTAPFTFNWDTIAVTEGQHMLQAVAHGALGTQVTSEVCTVTIDHTQPTAAFADISLPVIFSGEEALAVTATDTNGLSEIRLLVDDVQQDVLTDSPFEFTWDTTGLPDGAVTLSVEAVDPAGNTARTDLTGVVVNGGEFGNFIEDDVITWTIPGNWRVVDFHRMVHWEMPSGVTNLMAILQWDQPDWQIELAVGIGTCPHMGVRYAFDEGRGGQLVVTHTAEDMDLEQFTSGETWFLHLGLGTEMDEAAIDAIMLESTQAAFAVVMYE